MIPLYTAVDLSVTASSEWVQNLVVCKPELLVCEVLSIIINFSSSDFQLTVTLWTLRGGYVMGVAGVNAASVYAIRYIPNIK